MNKVIYLIIISLFFVACRKNRECQCVRKNNPEEKDIYELSISKKKDAEADCKAYFDSYSVYYESCELK